VQLQTRSYVASCRLHVLCTRHGPAHLDVRHAGTNIYLKATAICVKARNIYLKGYGYLRQGYGYLTRHGPAHLDVRTAAVKLLHRTLEREAAQSQARRLGTLGRTRSHYGRTRSHYCAIPPSRGPTVAVRRVRVCPSTRPSMRVSRISDLNGLLGFLASGSPAHAGR
jgi:hypothetical protein